MSDEGFVANPISGDMQTKCQSAKSALELAKSIHSRVVQAKIDKTIKTVAVQSSGAGEFVELTNFRSLQMPLWGATERAIPHDLIRCALFTSRERSSRQYYELKEIASSGNYSLTYTGIELRQMDLDVYLQILHIARGKKIDQRTPYVDFNGWDMLRELGWSVNSNNLDKLRACIRRMQACAVEISRKDHNIYAGKGLFLAYGCHYDNETRLPGKSSWRVVINTDIASKITPGSYAKIDWSIRRQLSSTGKWLQCYYHSQKEIFPIKLEKIKELCGCERELKLFKRDLKKDLEQLVSLGFIDSWNVGITNTLLIHRKKIHIEDGGVPSED